MRSAAISAGWRWRSGGGSGLIPGLAAQAAAIAVVVTAAYAILSRPDPAA